MFFSRTTTTSLVPLVASLVIATTPATPPAFAHAGHADAPPHAHRATPRTPAEDQRFAARTIAVGLPERASVLVAPPGVFTAEVELEDGPRQVLMSLESPRSEEYRMLVDRGDGVLETVETPAQRSYRGVIADERGSRVYAILDERGLTAVVKRVRADGDITTEVVRPADARRGEPALWGTHVVRTIDPEFLLPDACGADGGAPIAVVMPGGGGQMPDEGQGENEGGIAGGDIWLPGDDGSLSPHPGGYWQAQLAFDVDFEAYQQFNTLSEIADFIDIQVLLVNALYESPLAVCHRVDTIVVRSTANDPYFSSYATVRLDEMETYWNQMHTDIASDLCHLVTGVDLLGDNGSSTVLGRAAVGGLECPADADRRYGMSEVMKFDPYTMSLVVTHELGHNWGACHCNVPTSSCAAPGTDACGIMGSTLNGQTYWHPFNVAQVQESISLYGHCALLECACGSQLAVPGEYLSIQWALDTVEECGDTILVETGTYHMQTLELPESASVTILRPVGGTVVIKKP